MTWAVGGRATGQLKSPSRPRAGISIEIEGYNLMPPDDHHRHAPGPHAGPATFNANADAFLGAFPEPLSRNSTPIAAALRHSDRDRLLLHRRPPLACGRHRFKVAHDRNRQGFSDRAVDPHCLDRQPPNYMDGQVTSYNSGTGALVVNVTAIGGTGTLAVWTISILPCNWRLFVTLSGSETLTNKTLTTPVLSGTASGTTAGG